ncbi:MAG: PHP domain-containing protein, partial [Promethearchaeota archaeon]
FIFAAIYTLFHGSGSKQPIPDEAFNYKRKSDLLPKEGYFIDLHSHTLASDGWMTPEQNIKWHAANGFNAFVITDHNTSKNVDEILKLQEKYPDILIIPGYEWTTERVHLNFIGIKEYPYKVPGSPKDEDIEKAIKQAKDLGAVVMVDHITWTKDQPRHREGLISHPSREQLLEWGADGFEISNEMYWHDPRTIHLHEKWNGEWKGKKVFLGTGTDVHNPMKEFTSAWTELLLNKEERENISIDTVKKALLEGRTRTWQDFDYRKPPEQKFMTGAKQGFWKIFFAPIIAAALGATQVVKSKKELGSYIIWLFLISYILIRLLFYIFSII